MSATLTTSVSFSFQRSGGVGIQHAQSFTATIASQKASAGVMDLSTSYAAIPLNSIAPGRCFLMNVSDSASVTADGAIEIGTVSGGVFSPLLELAIGEPQVAAFGSGVTPYARRKTGSTGTVQLQFSILNG